MLRPYQLEALRKSKEKLDLGVKRQLLVLATGGGKTVVFANLRKHHGFTKKMLVLVHREELADQAADKIAKWNPGCNVGVEMGNRRATPMDEIVVASVPTIGKKNSPRLQQFDPASYDCVVCDEAHHSTADTYLNVFEHFGLMTPTEKSPLLLGVTATPNRSDGAGLSKVYDDIVFNMGMLPMIRDGWLADLRGVKVDGGACLDEVKIQRGDFVVGQLSETVNTPERNGTIVKEWFVHARDKQTIAFTVDIAHAQDLAAAYRAAGVRAQAVWGDDPQRAEKLEKHRKGEITVLTNCAVLTEGYDDWRVACIVMARPTKSQLVYVQCSGRGTRIPDGVSNLIDHKTAGIAVAKDNCLIIDVVDSSRHGLVTTPLIFGMNSKMDLKGKSAQAAAKILEDKAREYPYSDLSDLTDIDKIDSIATDVDLFRVNYSEEVKTCSDLSWRKLADGSGYFLSVPDREKVEIRKDLRDVYEITGSVNKFIVTQTCDDLKGAFQMADSVILAKGGVKTLLAREAKWHHDEPTPGQIKFCQKLRIHIPAGATKGQISKAIDAKLAMR